MVTRYLCSFFLISQTVRWLITRCDFVRYFNRTHIPTFKSILQYMYVTYRKSTFVGRSFIGHFLRNNRQTNGLCLLIMVQNHFFKLASKTPNFRLDHKNFFQLQFLFLVWRDSRPRPEWGSCDHHRFCQSQFHSWALSKLKTLPPFFVAPSIQFYIER